MNGVLKSVLLRGVKNKRQGTLPIDDRETRKRNSFLITISCDQVK